MNEPRKWEIIVLRRPERVLRRLPRDLLGRIRDAIRTLALNPRPPGCRKLAGHGRMYRIRVGGWRIVYVIEDDRLIGIISDTDIFRVFVEGLGGGHPSLRITVKVSEELMSLA